MPWGEAVVEAVDHAVEEVAQDGGAGGADAVLGPGPQPVTEFEFGDRPDRGVGGEARQPHAVRIREPQLGPGVRSFLPGDQPHALGGRPERRR